MLPQWAQKLKPLLLVSVLAISALALPAVSARATSTIEFLASLSEEEVANFRAWRQARHDYNDKLDAYWSVVERKRNHRKKKRSAKIAFSADDYVMSFPPTYAGPELSAAVARKYSAFAASQEKKHPSPSSSLPTVNDFLSAAKRVYNFVPERVSELEFKRRYAEEALALGLSKEQVVRVYALETGGIGTYDMQAGIHPTKKTGRAISSALGYAQLLSANTVNVLSEHGKTFIKRLIAKSQQRGISDARRAQLKDKISALKEMYANARRIPHNWRRHQAYARTQHGQGMHALNIDADIGPMLQATKLKSIKDFAARYDRNQLTGAQLELMNLSGPMTGIEMMRPLGLKAPVTNSFTRDAYYVNKMVIGLTGEQLLAELNRRMDLSIKTDGSQEFVAAFDDVMRTRSTASR